MRSLRSRWLTRFACRRTFGGAITVATTFALALLGSGTALLAQSDASGIEGVMGRRPDALRIGGHVGVIVPFLRREGAVSRSVDDRFIVGVPVGLTLKPRGPLAVDLEFVPLFNTPDALIVVLHPGLVYGFGSRWAVGARAAWEAGAENDARGATLLLSRGLALVGGRALFAEFDVPIRSVRADGARRVDWALVAHLGLAF